jgi:autotransporter-associated beta strand protein
MKPKAFRPIFASSIVAISFVATVHAQSIWIGNTSPDWGTASNWNPASVPAAGANIVINDTTGNPLVLDTNRAIGNFQVGNTGTRTGSTTIRTQINQLAIAGGVTAIGSFTNVGPSFFGNLSITADQNWNIGGQIGTHNGDRGVFIREVTNATGTATDVGSLLMAANLTKIGSGQLVMAATTVSGAGNFIVNEGALKLNAGASRLLTVGGSGNITVNNNAQLFVSRNSGTMAITRDIILNGTAAMVWGGGTGSTNTIASNIAWNGTSHDIQLATSGINYNSTGAWTGSATVNRTGASTLTASGDFSGFTGTLNLQGGTTNLTGPGLFSGNLGISGGTATVAGNIAGNVSLTGGTTTLSGATVAGIFALGAGTVLNGEVVSTGNMTLDGGQFSANPLTAGSLGTLGDLTLSGTNTVAFSATPASTAPFTVLTYGGTLSGGIGNLAMSAAANFRSPVFGHDSVAKVITLAVGIENRTWNGGADWDINTSANWQEGDLRFLQVDHVTFTDTGAGSVALVGDLIPSSITINNSVGNDYTFTAAAGINRIFGSTGIVKSGVGNVTLGGANTYTGGVTINGGTLRITNNQALGANGNLITIADGAALDLNGAHSATRDYQAVIAGSGVGGTGAIVNTGGGQNHGFGSITLTADATIGGSGRWDLRPIVAGTGVLDLAGHTLTKAGTGLIGLVDSVFTSNGTIQVSGGELRYTRNSTGVTTGLVSLAPTTTFTFENHSSGDFGWNFAINDATVRNLGASTVTMISDVALTNTATFLIAPAPFVIDGNLSGTGGLLKTGAQTLTLLGDASHSGGTTVSGGTLQIGNGGETGSIAGNILNDATVAFNRSDDVTYTLPISGTGALAKAGEGVLTLTALQSYSGATNINGGTLKLDGGEGTLPLVTLVTLANAAGASLDLNGNKQEIRGLAGGGAIGGSVINSGAVTTTLACRPTGDDSITFAGILEGDIRFEVLGTKVEPSFIAPRQRLSNLNNTFTGGVLVDGGTLMVREDGSLGTVPASFQADHITLSNNGVLLNETDPPFSLSIHPNRGITLGNGGGGLVAGFNTNINIGSAISGAPGNPLTILQNNGVVIFTADNFYQGQTVLQAQGGNGIGRLQIGNGGTTGTLGSGAVINDGLLRFNRSDAITAANHIAGTGQVVQQGSGTTILTGTMSYSGSTTVEAGTLGGGGSAASETTVLNGGTLAPGANVGTMSTAALTFQTGSAMQWEINSTAPAADRVVANGNVTLGAGSALAVSDIAGSPAALALGTKFVVIEYTGFTLDGTFNSLPEGATLSAGPNTFAIAYADTSDGVSAGNFVTLTVVTAAPSGFAAWAADNGVTGGIGGDDDNDGVANGIEFFLGDDSSGFTAMPVPDATGKITWPMGSDYNGSYGTDFVVLTSSTLAEDSWLPVPAGQVTVTPGVSLVYTLPEAAGRIFARLEVTGPD